MSSHERSCAVVLTTIHDPVVLEGYFENFQAHDRLDRAEVIVIPDEKTPEAAYQRCQALTRKGLHAECPPLHEQDDYLIRLGVKPTFVPRNSDNRRNIGYLMALEKDVDFVISIDDDNFCREDDDFLRSHSVVCEPATTYDTIDSSSGWFNICDLLDCEPPYPVYPRGFPYHKKHCGENISLRKEQCQVRLNAGLWLGEPDLDGITWLVAPVRASGFKGESYVLSENVWSPINTQNTALHRDLVPAYYFPRMGYPLAGMPIDRYGDIFSGYFLQACMKNAGDRVRVGTPVAEHRRNHHNYLKDAANEFPCLLVLEDLTDWLMEVELEGGNYLELYSSLSYSLQDIVEKFTGSIWTDPVRAYFHQMAHYMRLWIRLCRRILGSVG